MTQPGYSFEQDEAALRFDFESISEHKTIRKRILYSPTAIPNLYNLALGDVLSNDVLDDTVRSNNDDRNEIIATVVQTIIVFFQTYPDCAVYFEGSDPKGIRTRLYRAVISRELDNIRDLFSIYGVYNDNSIEVFERNKLYVAFIIKKNHEQVSYESNWQ